MNDTNRAFNRFMLIVIGLVMLGLGGAVITVFAWPAAADFWTNATTTGRSWLENAIAASALGTGALSGIALAVITVIVVLIALLIVALTRLGGGRSKTLVGAERTENDLGRVQVRAAFASDALQNSLGNRGEILFSSVRARTVRKQQVMHVSVTPRQNTSPRQVADDVDTLARNLSTLTGEEIPTYISIHSGLRAKLAHDQRRLS